MTPDATTFSAMIESFARCRHWKRVIEIFYIMKENHLKWTAKACIPVLVLLKEDTLQALLPPAQVSQTKVLLVELKKRFAKLKDKELSSEDISEFDKLLQQIKNMKEALPTKSVS
jgi:pentatricopeptide repeat protein